MTSVQKVAANRRNAKKSTGPRTEAGQRRSRRNAFRHGLAVAIASQPSYRDDIQALATALTGSAGLPSEFALQVAEAEIDLLRINQVRARHLDAIFEVSGTSEGYAELAHDLDRVDRYERRAYSKRNRALRALISYPLGKL